MQGTKPTAIDILMYFSSNRMDDKIYPAKVVKGTGRSITMVMRHLDELKDLGLIEVHDKKNRNAYYRLTEVGKEYAKHLTKLKELEAR